MTRPSMDLQGALDYIGKSTHSLAPLYEALTNSLESIAQRNFSEEESVEIIIKFYFTGLTEDSKQFEKMEIIDTGEGFTKKNYDRFFNFFDKSKGFHNRGTGRLQFLHRFKKVKIDSTYFDDEGKKQRRYFDFDVQNFIDDENTEDGSDAPYITKIAMLDYFGMKKETEFFNNLTASHILNDVKKWVMLRFYLSSQKEYLPTPQINIEFLFNDKKVDEAVLSSEQIPEPKATGEVKVNYMKNTGEDDFQWDEVIDKHEVINWAHFKLPIDVLNQNGVHLCSKNLPVTEFKKFKEIKKNQDINGFRYLTVFYGGILDEPKNVTHAVDGFTFPRKKDAEKPMKDMHEPEEYIFMEEIEKEIMNILPSIYNDIFAAKEKAVKNAETIAESYGISPDIVAKANIAATDNEESVTKKVFEAHTQDTAEKSYRTKKLYESLDDLDPTTEDYDPEMEKIITEIDSLIEDIDKSQLSLYVVRRSMVTRLLKRIIEGSTRPQTEEVPGGKRKDKEGLIHDLIFKRRSKENDPNNNLWILNEEFLYFDGCSEVSLEQIKDSKGNKLLRDDIPEEQKEELKSGFSGRPDIFLFLEEGKCIIVELKEPNADVSKFTEQMIAYCNYIANYSKEPIEKFYCYLIGENIDERKFSGRFRNTVSGDLQYPSEPIVSFNSRRTEIATAQLDIIKLSSIHRRAFRRNKIFAEKLNLSEILEDEEELQE